MKSLKPSKGVSVPGSTCTRLSATVQYNPSQVMKTEPQLPPGPSRLAASRMLWTAGSRFLQFLQDTAKTYGDIAHFKVGPRRYYLLSHPDDIHDILVKNADRFIKGPALRQSQVTLGQGLLTSEHDLHRRQRQLITPAFHPRQVQSYTQTMLDFTRQRIASWHDQQRLDIKEEMTQLTLQIVAKVLFDADLADDVRAIGEAMAVTVTMFDRVRSPLAPILNRLPLPANYRFKRALRHLREVIEQMIQQRRSSTATHGDLLSLLLGACNANPVGAGSPRPLSIGQATKEGGETPPLQKMSDQQLRDEMITLFTAGHETTANALVWTLVLLAQHPDVESKFHEELSQSDTPGPYVRAVLSESMRLYPPAWVIGRECIQDHEVRGYRLPVGSVILVSQWVTHRDPRWFLDPKKFNPDRWLCNPSHPRYAYFPFGGGPRSCIGEPFAWNEATVLLSTIARQWKLKLIDSNPIPLHPTITLRPAGPVWMTAHAQQPATSLSPVAVGT